MSRLSSPAGLHNEVETLNERVVTLSAGTTLLTKESHSNRLLLVPLGADDYTVTLPHASGSGDTYEFLMTSPASSSGATLVIDCAHTVSSNTFRGTARVTHTSGNLALDWTASSGLEADRISLNGTTTGGAEEGDYIRLVDVAVGRWQIVAMHITSSGAQATPFSAP